MKTTNILLLALMCIVAIKANGTEPKDTTSYFDDIIQRESQVNVDKGNAKRLRGIWDNTTFLNISLNNTKLESAELPSENGIYALEFKQDIGAGIQMGRTYNFHKKPLGSVVFFGLDYTWIDLNFNKYKKSELPVIDNLEPESQPKNVKYMPWNHEKMTLDYGMSIGPSIMFYPFTSLNKDGTDKIRFQTYFHVGYNISGMQIKDVNEKEEYAYGHGLFTAFGLNLTWSFIGLGYEWVNRGNMKYKCTKEDYDIGSIKFKEKPSRFYLQFRF